MLNKIALGTANFSQKYGILGGKTALDRKVVADIVAIALRHGINTFDTGFAYGNLFEILKDNQAALTSNFITKFSVFDDYDDIATSLESLVKENLLKQFYGLLVHDPHNLSSIDPDKLRKWLNEMRSSGLVSKVGVSAYEFKEIHEFHNIMIPELIQIPLNPLNQRFATQEFISYISSNNIELHARSLFLQGVLLMDHLPDALIDLKPIWNDFIKIAGKSNERLAKILGWALNQKHVNKWVLGVSSVEDLEQIVNRAQIKASNCIESLFAPFKENDHPLADPRNWKLA